jgi:signal transduction histidine kinase
MAELRAALAHRELQIRAMQRTSEALLSHSAIDAMVRETLTLAIEVLGADAGSLLLHNPATDTLVFRNVVGPAADALTGFAMPASHGIAGRVFRSGKPDITHEVAARSEHNKEVDAHTGYTTESMATVPVKRSSGPPIGVMQILNSATPFDERDLEVLQVMAAQASAAIENARLVQEARKAEIVNVIGDISHDIKNMLTPIQSGVWTLEMMLEEMFASLDEISAACPASDVQAQKIKGAADQTRRDYQWILHGALAAAERVQQRTKEIADAVKGESAAPVFAPGSLNLVAREVAQSLSSLARNSQLELRLDLDEALPHAEFDARQMYNALYNLANNAIPETPPGGSVTLRTLAPGEGDDFLTIQVQDTGKGMPAHIKEGLFTDEAVSTKPGGTGMGTRIVGDVVRRHNGVIRVESEVGSGSTFTILLPLRRS